MTPDMILLVGQLLLKYGPQIADAFVKLVHKKDPTLEDWNALFAIAEKSYEDYVKPSDPAPKA